MGVPWFRRYAKHCAAVGYCTYRSKNLILKSSLPPSYVAALRKYFPDDWLQWRDRCTKHNAHVAPPEELAAKALLNEVRFRRAIDRETL